MKTFSYRNLIDEYQELENTPEESSRKKEILSLLNENRSQGFGEIIGIGYQFLVSKDSTNNRRLIKYFIPSEPKEVKESDQPYLKFKTRQVFEDDNEKELQKVIQLSKLEYNWFTETFKTIPLVDVLPEVYSVGEYPFGGLQTVKISTKYIDNIKTDICSIKGNYLTDLIGLDSTFKDTIVLLLDTIIQLAEVDIYPDYLGDDNFAIYLKDDLPRVALIDPHVIWIGSECRVDVKAELNTAILGFRKLREIVI